MTRSWKSFAATGLGHLMVAGAVAAVSHARRRAVPPTDPDTDTLRINLDLCCGPVHVTDGHLAGQMTADDCLSMVRREVDELTSLADHLYGMTELAGHEDEVAEESFVRLDDLRWLLGNYVIKGGRIRRLTQLPELLRTTDSIDQPGERLPHRGIAEVRANAGELWQRIMETNVVTADWLLAHRVALPDPEYLDSNALLGRYHRLEIEPTCVSGDPLYLLTCHIHDILETVDTLGDLDHPVLDVLETQLARILKAVENEITTAQAFNTALITLVREMRSADAA